MPAGDPGHAGVSCLRLWAAMGDGMTDPESFAILDAGRKRAGELAATATTDGQRVDGEVSVSATGGGWWAKAWAKVTARKATKPDLSAGVEVTKRW